MVLAYVLVRVEAGKSEEVAEKIKGMAEVKRANFTYGIYDIITEVDLESLERLDEFVFTKLRRILGVNETVTMIASKRIV